MSHKSDILHELFNLLLENNVNIIRKHNFVMLKQGLNVDSFQQTEIESTRNL